MHQVQRKIHLPKTTVWLKIKTCNLQYIKSQCSWNASCFYEYNLQFQCYHVTRIRRHFKNKGIKCSIPDGLWLKNIKKYRVKPLLIKYHFNNQSVWPRQRDGLYGVVNMLLFEKLTGSFRMDSIGNPELYHAKQCSVYSDITMFWDLKRCVQCFSTALTKPNLLFQLNTHWILHVTQVLLVLVWQCIAAAYHCHHLISPDSEARNSLQHPEKK